MNCPKKGPIVSNGVTMMVKGGLGQLGLSMKVISDIALCGVLGFSNGGMKWLGVI